MSDRRNDRTSDREPARIARDRGAASTEYVGAILVAAALMGLSLLSVAAIHPEAGLNRAVCKLLTVGLGDCGSLPSAADREPTQPCVISGTGTTNTVRAGAAVIGQGSERWLIEELGDGRFRLTRATGTGVGGTVGAGFDLTYTYNDNDYGFSLGAEANALAAEETGEVYYVSSQKQAEDFLTERRVDSALDGVIGDGGLARGLVDKVRGGNRLPEPDETWQAAGVIGDAKATVDWIALGAQANINSQTMIGTRLRKDGSGTAYYSTNMSGQAAAAMWAADDKTGATTLYKAQVNGTVGGVAEVDYDSKGKVTALRIKSTLGGSAAAGSRGVGEDNQSGPSPNAYTDLTVELPLDTAEAREHAAGVAAAFGIPYVPGLSTGLRSPVLDPAKTRQDVSDFMDDVRSRGRIWRDDYDLNLNTDLGLNVDARWITGVLVDASSNSMVRTSTSQQYFDGHGWREREGCTK